VKETTKEINLLTATQRDWLMGIKMEIKMEIKMDSSWLTEIPMDWQKEK